VDEAAQRDRGGPVASPNKYENEMGGLKDWWQS
jgi:hypothetical protein